MHTLLCIGANNPWIGGKSYTYTVGDRLVLSKEHAESLLSRYKGKWKLIATDVEAESSIVVDTGRATNVDISTSDMAFFAPIKADPDNYTPPTAGAQEDPLKTVYGEMAKSSTLFMEDMFKVQVVEELEAGDKPTAPTTAKKPKAPVSKSDGNSSASITVS